MVPATSRLRIDSVPDFAMNQTALPAVAIIGNRLARIRSEPLTPPGRSLMADGGELSAAFRALAGDAAQAGEDIGDSMGRWFEDTADIEDENVSRTLAADAENARALNAIRPDTGNLPEGGAGWEGKPSQIAKILGGEDGAGGAGEPSQIAKILGGEGGASTAELEGEPSQIAKILSGEGDAGGASSVDLTDGDRAALHDYTTNDGYTTMNPFLRNPDGYSDAEKAAIQARADRVSTGLAKLPAQPGTTYRGVNFSSDIAKNYQEGTVVTERAFTSTSTDASVATGAFDGNTLMTVTGHSGRDIAPFSDYPESEILYDKGTQFQVIRNAFDPAIGKTVIQMREVG